MMLESGMNCHPCPFQAAEGTQDANTCWTTFQEEEGKIFWFSDIRSPERPDSGINVKDENYKSIFCHAEFYTLINRANAWGTIERDRRGRP
jgi:hypothetical protein